MATVTGYTAARMKKIEDESIVDGVVNVNDLILARRDGTLINAGNVRGPQGEGLPNPPSDDITYGRRNGLWVPSTQEAPKDGITYARKNGGWVFAAAEAPMDGKAYARKDFNWVLAPQEAPVDGRTYIRRDAGWAPAPGLILGSKVNDDDTTTGTTDILTQANGGCAISISVGTRGVTIEYGALIGHSVADKGVRALLLINGTVIGRSHAPGWVPAAGAIITLGKTLTLTSTDILAGDYTLEVKTKQDSATATMTSYQVWITARSH